MPGWLPNREERFSQWAKFSHHFQSYTGLAHPPLKFYKGLSHLCDRNPNPQAPPASLPALEPFTAANAFAADPEALPCVPRLSPFYCYKGYPHSLLLLQGNTLIPFYCYKGIPSIPFNITREYPYSLLKVQGDGASGFPWRARYDTIAGAGGHRGKKKGVDASAVVDLSEPAQALEPGF